MKALCLAVVVFLGGALSHSNGQGTVVFFNRILERVGAPVFGPEPGDPSIELHGNPPAGGTLGGFPAGTQVYQGAPLRGSGYTVQLWGGPLAAAPGYDPVLGVVATTFFRTGSAVGYFLASPSAGVPVPGVGVGERAAFEVRAWENRGGTITSWSQVLADPAILRGQSGVFYPPSPLGEGNTAPAYLEGLQSFNLHVVPEPGLLGVVGVGWAAVRLFRKRRR